MTVPYRPRLERPAVAGLLMTVGACCLCLAWSTADLESANARCRSQMRLLDELAGNPSLSAAGPVQALDGLYERRVFVVATDHGAALWFEPGTEPRSGSGR